jgi:hypothetical protein
MYEAQIQTDLEYVEALVLELLRIENRSISDTDTASDTETLN